MFQDLHELTLLQNESIQHIVISTEHSKESIKQSVVELNKATEYKKSATKKNMIIGMIIGTIIGGPVGGVIGGLKTTFLCTIGGGCISLFV